MYLRAVWGEFHYIYEDFCRTALWFMLRGCIGVAHLLSRFLRSVLVICSEGIVWPYIKRRIDELRGAPSLFIYYPRLGGPETVPVSSRD